MKEHEDVDWGAAITERLELDKDVCSACDGSHEHDAFCCGCEKLVYFDRKKVTDNENAIRV